MAYIIFDENGKAKGPIAKFLEEDKLAQLKESAGLADGDAVFFACDFKDEAAKLAGLVRTRLGEELELIDENEFKFCWIVDYPMYEIDETTKKIEAAGGDTEKLLALTAFQYDIVCNGIELSSGAIRNHTPELMYKAFEIAGYDNDEVDSRFGGMIRAFKYGAPPHGGIAPGIDRIIMLLADEPNIREVICFPMNQQAQDILMGAPAEADPKQLRELNIQLSVKAKQLLEEEKEQAALSANEDTEEDAA